MLLITKLSEAEQVEKKKTISGLGEPDKFPLSIKVVGGPKKGYGAYVMEFKGDQLLVKHIIVEGCKMLWEAKLLGEQYKAEHPNFPWR